MKAMSYCFLAALCVQVACGQLTWNGPAGAAWDAAGEHWLDAGGQPTVWRDGETAVIPGGVTVPVSGHFRVAGITFTGDGSVLAGVGTLRLDGDITAAAGTLNAISTSVTTDTAIRKTGAGTLAASALKGAVRVAEGALIAGGSDFQNVDLQVASGASFSLLSIVSKEDNLLVNGSFEEPFYNGHRYVAGETVPTGWEVPEGNNYINHQNTAGSGTWSNGDAGGTTDIPDGDMMLVVQNIGEISQTVSVSEGGLYDLSMIHFRRSASGTYYNHVVYVSVDGVPVRVLNSRNISSDWWRFSTGPLLLAAGSHTITFRGEGMWGDNSTFIDDVRFGKPTETEPTVAMTAASSLAAEAGATVNLTFTGSMVEHTLRPTLDLSRFDLPAAVTRTGAGTVQQDPFGYLAREDGGLWSTATTWADNHAPLYGGSPAGSLTFPLAADTTYTSDLGTYILNRLTLSGTDPDAPVTFSGSGLSFTNQNGLARSMAYLTKRGSGAAILAMPLAVSTFWTIDVEGSLDILQPIAADTDIVRAYKTGTGLLTLNGDTSGFAMFSVMEGTCIVNLTTGIKPYFEIRGTRYSVPALYFRYTDDYSTDRDFNLLAGGTAILGTMGGGHVYLMDSTVICGAPLGVFDIGAGDTFITKRVRRLVADSNKLMADSDILKIGPGTLRFTKRDTGNGSFTGAMIVRDGALELAASDLASGALNPLTGTSEVAFPLIGATITTPLVLSDEATEGTADIAFRLVEDHVMTARPIRIGPQARSVTLEQTEGTGIMSGEITLARSDLTIGGGAQNELVVGPLTLEDVSSATVTVAGGLNLTLDGELTGAFNVTAPTGVSAGYNRSKQLTIASLTLSGETTISFDSEGNDCFHAVNLTVPDFLLIHLQNDQTREEGYGYPGSYTLFTYDSFTGSLDNIALAAASQLSGYSYSLGDTGNAIILTIRSAGDNPNYTWINDGDGEWKDAGNWDHDTAPNLADLTVSFGPAATQPVTVTLDDGFMFGDMVFANAHGFTLTGGALQFLKSGTPSITVEYGSHTIMSAITNNTAQELQIKTTGSGSLKLGGAIKSDIDVIGSSISFTDTATINGRLTLDENSVLAVSDTVKLATTGNSTLMGDISGTGTLVKDGSSTLRVERDNLSFTGTTRVEEGTLEVAGSYPGTVDLAAAGTLRNDGSVHGLSVTSYGLTSTDVNNLMGFLSGAYEYKMFDRQIRTFNRKGSFIFNYPGGLTFSDRAEDTSGNEVTIPSDLHSSDYWAAVFEGTINLPVSGYYRFRTAVDDGFILAIDGQHMCAATNVLTATETHYLNAGQHAFYLGLVEWTGNAYVNVWIRQPNETTYKPLPIEWLTPLQGADTVVGAGTIQSAAGAAFTVNQAGGAFTPFTGTFAGPSGASLFKNGLGDFWTGYSAGGLINRAGILTVTSPAATYPSLSISGGGITLVNGGTVETLAGVGVLGIGNTVKKVYFTGDADCGISPDKTYTHRINFPTTETVTIMGMEFGAFGDFELKNWSTGQAGRVMGAEDGICRMMENFWYGSIDQSITLTGLQPDTAYEARFYFRNWDNNFRYGRMIFSAGSRGAGAIDCEFDSGWGAKDQMGYVACRYRTDATGTFTARVLSLANDKIHIYGLSNELAEDAAPEPAVLTVSASDGVKTAYRGVIGGDGSLIKRGSGTQIFGNQLSLSGKVLVEEGVAVLEKPTLAQVEVASGATVSLRPGASVKGLAGEGMVQLEHPDLQPWGELQADGTFAAVDFPKQIRFSGDADCGISSAKEYPLAMSLANVSDYEDVIHVNDVVFRRASPGTALERDYRSGWTVQGLPGNTHGGGNDGWIGTGSDQAIYQVLYGMNYGGNGTIIQKGTVSGTTYETRFYMRIWDGNNVDRTVRISYVDGGVEKSIEFNEDSSADRRPYYVACRYTATSNLFPITFTSLRNDQIHIYGLSTEVVRDYTRTFDVDDDQTFAGTVFGDGEIRKTGIGSITFSGFFYNDAPLTVKQGAFLLGNADNRIGNVAVQAGGAFGGIGEVGGSLGFSFGSRLVSGTAEVIGEMSVDGAFVVANGTSSTFRYKDGHTGGFTAQAIALPDVFDVDFVPTAGDRSMPVRGTLFHSENGFGTLDLSEWRLTVGGTPLPAGAKVSFSKDGKSIEFMNAEGTVLIFN